MRTITLAPLIRDNMVLQQGQLVHIFGEGDEGTVVTVTFRDETKETVVEHGKWEIYFREGKCVTPLQSEEYMLVIEATNPKTATSERKEIKNIVFGEVWIASGQSNIEFKYKFDAEKLDNHDIVDDLDFRYFDVPKTSYPGQLDAGDFSDYGLWRIWSANDAEWFSAVAVYFGIELRKKLNVPIGIIGISYGGASAASFTSSALMQSTDNLRNVVSEYEKNLNNINMEEYIEATDWMTRINPKEIREELEILFGENDFKMAIQKLQSRMTDKHKKYASISMEVGPRSFRKPSSLYDHMVSRVIGYPVKGVIWYQGEEDEISRASFYDESLRAVIQSFRQHWGHVPFLIVSLPSWEGSSLYLATNFHAIREKILEVSDTEKDVYVMNGIDVGERNDIHPRHKRNIGERLALLAQQKVYQLPVHGTSPRLERVKKIDNTIELYFQDIGEGLKIVGCELKELNVTADGYRLLPDVVLEENKLVLYNHCFEGNYHFEILYSQENYCEPNLYSLEGLPVFPFKASIEKSN